MADFAPSYGQRCEDGGFQFSEVLEYYPSAHVVKDYINKAKTDMFLPLSES